MDKCEREHAVFSNPWLILPYSLFFLYFPDYAREKEVLKPHVSAVYPSSTLKDVLQGVENSMSGSFRRAAGNDTIVQPALTT